MLFNSYIFIFAFLPITLIGYFALNLEDAMNTCTLGGLESGDAGFVQSFAPVWSDHAVC